MTKLTSILLLLPTLALPMTTSAETQLTFAPYNHDLDQGDNFSPDGQFLVYDTRETVGPGIENCLSIEKVAIATGKTTVLYRPEKFQVLKHHAPGVGAASYSPVADEVVFIHGPDVDEVATRGPYTKPNRRGAHVPGNGSMTRSWLDLRDVDTTRDTTPGAHRGGTHRHEFSRDGNRIGYTYDDFLLTQYDRTVAYMEASVAAPEGATHYCAVLVPVVPKGTSKPGEIEKAYGDSWIDREGTMRGFIGIVRENDGSMQQSLFVIDIPKNVDITTGDSGGPNRYPTPPTGVTIRRLTYDWAEGIVRGSFDGTRIAFFGKDGHGEVQAFVIAADGSEKQPRQVTRVGGGIKPTLGIRWHPNDDDLLVCADDGIAAIAVNGGELRWLTSYGDGLERSRAVVSQDGKLVAYNRLTPTLGPDGAVVKNYAGMHYMQIFTATIE